VSSGPTGPNVLLLATGSVATIKLPLLVTLLLQYPLNLRVILTPTAERFLSVSDVSSIASQVQLYRNEDEWAKPWARGDPVLHIELRKWADLMLIAPLSANTLASMAAGLCNGLGMSVVRAWDTTDSMGDRGGGMGEAVGGGTVARRAGGRRKMILVAPAMNTQMYLHPLTEQHLDVLRNWQWVDILSPVEKTLACGDIGVGGMMEVPQIVDNVVSILALDPTENAGSGQ